MVFTFTLSFGYASIFVAQAPLTSIMDSAAGTSKPQPLWGADDCWPCVPTLLTKPECRHGRPCFYRLKHRCCYSAPEHDPSDCPGYHRSGFNGPHFPIPEQVCPGDDHLPGFSGHEDAG